MNTHRALGLLVAILITTGEALILATDTSATAQSPQGHTRYVAPRGAGTAADAPLAYSGSRDLIGG